MSQNYKELINTITNDISIKTVTTTLKNHNLLITYHTVLSSINDLYKYFTPYITEENITSLDKEFAGTFKKSSSLSDLTFKILSGTVLFYLEDADLLYEVDLKKPINRTPGDSIIDPVNMYQARDGFIEDINYNIALIEQRINSKSFTIDEYMIGKSTKTKISILYLNDKIEKNDLKIIEEKLRNIDIDSITTVNDVASPFNKKHLFPLISETGLPSLAADYLVQGRFIIAIDNFPVVLVLPITLDYFTILREENTAPPYYSIYHRLLTIMMFFFSVFFLGIYIASMNYHSQNLSLLIISEVKMSTRGATIPLYMEIILMLFIFEFVRLASYKAPSSNVLNMVIIIGGIIIGQNVINSGFVGAFNIVITALSFLSTFGVTSNQYLLVTLSILRFLIILIGTLFGFYGIVIASVAIIIYLYNLKSLNSKYLSPLAPLYITKFVQTFISPNLYKNKTKEKKGDLK